MRRCSYCHLACDLPDDPKDDPESAISCMAENAQQESEERMNTHVYVVLWSGPTGCRLVGAYFDLAEAQGSVRVDRWETDPANPDRYVAAAGLSAYYAIERIKVTAMADLAKRWPNDRDRERDIFAR